MGLFNFKKNKVDKKQLSQKELALNTANNVFKSKLLSDEVIVNAISGKCDSQNLIFSVGSIAATEKRVMYYFQDGSKTGVESIMYDKIVSISEISGFESKMGNYIGVSIELPNGLKRVVRCVNNDEQQSLINELIFYIETKR